MRKRQPLLGIGVALVSAAAFGTSGAFAKSLMNAGWSPGIVTRRITLGALVLLGPTVFALRGRWDAARRNAGAIVGFGLFAVAGCQFAYFSAVTHLSIGVALLIEYLAPVLVVGWLWLRRGQRPPSPHRPRSAALDARVASRTRRDGGGQDEPGRRALGTGCRARARHVLSLGGPLEDGLPPLGFAGCGLAVATVILWLAGLSGAMDLTRGAAQVGAAGHLVAWWVPILVIGVVAAAFAFANGVAAVRMLGSKVGSFLALTEVLFAIVFAWIVLAELPTVIQLVGGALIVGGVIAVRADELRPGSSTVLGSESDGTPAGAITTESLTDGTRG